MMLRSVYIGVYIADRRTKF